MKQIHKLALLIMLLAIGLAACGGSAQPTIAPEATGTKAPTEEPTEEPKPTKTQILTGPIATANALIAQQTIIPSTPIGGAVLEEGDYVGLFNQAWIIVRDNYVRDDFNGVDWDAVRDEYEPLFEAVDNDEDYWDLMSDLIHELNDNHSRYVPPARMNAEFGTSGGSNNTGSPWTGLEIWPAKEDEQLMIWYVCSNGPAANSGLRRGDVILAIDGKAVVKSDQDWESADYRAAVFGNEGNSNVTLTVQRGPDSEAEDVTLQLGGANGCDTWTHFLLSESPRIGYVRIINYGGNATAELLTRIQAMEESAALDGLVIDQRHNPGGSLGDLANAVTLFAEGIVGSDGPIREGEQRTIFRIRGPVEWSTTTPVVVLTDGNSHSAADMFPASMKELGRATILGMPSAGNTEAITGFSISDGTLIRLAISAFLLNDGSPIEGDGVIPDVVVPLGDWGLGQLPFDIQLQAALDFLLGQ
jgi:C-terminal peptidase prc